MTDITWTYRKNDWRVFFLGRLKNRLCELQIIDIEMAYGILSLKCFVLHFISWNQRHNEISSYTSLPLEKNQGDQTLGLLPRIHYQRAVTIFLRV